MKENNKNKQNLVTRWTYEFALDIKIEEDLQSQEMLRKSKEEGMKTSSMEGGA